MSLEALKEKNQVNLSESLKPYQPLVYALPKDQWEAILKMLADNLTLIPEMQLMVNLTPTRDELHSSEARIKHEVGEMETNLNRSITSLTSQVGSTRETVTAAVRAVLKEILLQWKHIKSCLVKAAWIAGGWLILQAVLLGLAVLSQMTDHPKEEQQPQIVERRHRQKKKQDRDHERGEMEMR